MDDLRKKHPEAEFIIVIEGVLMYFYEKQVRQLLTIGRPIQWWRSMVRCMRAYDGKLKYIKPDSLRGHEAQIPLGLKRRASSGKLGTTPATY